MYRNRISSYFPWDADLQPTVTRAEAPVQAFQSETMVVVPQLTTQQGWQAQLLKIAYEKALHDTTPARHVRRFSWWT